MFEHFKAQFISTPMAMRDKRLQTAKRNVKQVISKELKNDRKDLNKKERELLIQLRSLEKSGEHYKARLVASQIAQYRAISDRNFEAETHIVTRAQTMQSDHRINKGELEAIKAINYANKTESPYTAGMRTAKYSDRMNEYQEIESMMNEGMSDIYDEAEATRPKFKFVESEVDSIMREALTGKKECSYDRKPSLAIYAGGLPRLCFKRFEVEGENTSLATLTDLASSDNISVAIGSLDFSIDMLKRELLRNELAISLLGIKPDKIGRIVTGLSRNTLIFGKLIDHWESDVDDEPTTRYSSKKFIPFIDPRMSLKEHGIVNGDIIHVIVQDVSSIDKKV